MSLANKTIGPIHFEDMEPHRFEDLVRQLLYDFRNWMQLESTGRTGSDEGFDVRGWEIVASLDESVEEEDDPATAPRLERQWLIQCKREGKIGPTKLRKYLEEVVEGNEGDLHGLIFVASCDFSKKSRDEFRSRVRELGLNEAYLWGKGEIEDLLFQPKNDHLLFAYTGISLQMRKRSLKAEIRARLATKRKVKRWLSEGSTVLVRDASDDRYPNLDSDETMDRSSRGRWQVLSFEECVADGLKFLVKRCHAFIDEQTGEWDRSEFDDDAIFIGFHDPWLDDSSEISEMRLAVRKKWTALPSENSTFYTEYRIMPYDNVLDIDQDGDEICSCPHIYTTPYHPEYGPFWGYFFPDFSRDILPDHEKRVDIFPKSKEVPKKADETQVELAKGDS